MSDSRGFLRLLLPVAEPDFGRHAIQRAAALIRRPGVTVTLLAVVDARSARERSPEYRADPRHQPMLDRLEEARLELSETGVVAQTQVLFGTPGREIAAEANRGNHDLIVLTTRGRSELGRLFLGSVAQTAIRDSPVPVMLFRRPCGLDESLFDVHRSEPALFRKILVMLDGSGPALAVLEPAIRLARAFGSELILFHAVPPRGFHQQRIEAARAYLSLQADRVSELGFASRIQIVVGDPVEESLRALKGYADTLALATRLSSPWRVAALGSTAASLLAQAEGPVLCVSSNPAVPRILGPGKPMTAVPQESLQ